MLILLLLIVICTVIFGVPDVRRSLITKPLFTLFKKILPPLSDTEREAMEAGDVWWDGELFKGKPDWSKLHSIPKPELSAEEQAFMTEQVETLLHMLDDYKIVQEQRDLPAEVWRYLKQEGFFAMIIPKAYGGREFSALANSTIVARIASRSLTAAVTVMVPNSLGPAELLLHYGTQQQKDRWLPALANGTEIPCFALTGPEAGSDAGGITDSGIITKGLFEGEEIIGIRLNWNKRYITLAPVATVLGLAFKLYDPEHLLGEQEDIGITCALIPTTHPGVQIGDRHLPMNMAFMNGTTYGENVFIPLDWIIGGAEFAGRGWRMLIECLSAGRGISLPALATASGHLSTRMTSAYALVRKQFGLSIGKFEGVQEALARIAAFTYKLEALRLFTAGAIDLKLSPAVATAISKYHMTEMSRVVVNDAFDIHAGRAIQMGPKNYLAHAYMGIPVSITVEGANILTRNLIIFGQGATRCHPYVLAELEAAANPDTTEGLKQFDSLLFSHIGFGLSNTFSALWQGITAGYFNDSPVSGETATYYKQLSRMSRALALSADFAMLMLGGDLKRREMLSARLGDVLSHLYISSAVLKFYEDNGRQQADLPFVHYSIQHSLAEIGKAFDGLFTNFPNRIIAVVLRRFIFPFGIGYRMPTDKIAIQICEALSKPGVIRDRLTHLCFIGSGENDPTAIMEQAFVAMHQTGPIMKKLTQAQRNGVLPRKQALQQTIEQALAAGVLTSDEADALRQMDILRVKAINVDSFKAGSLEKNTISAEIAEQ